MPFNLLLNSDTVQNIHSYKQDSTCTRTSPISHIISLTTHGTHDESHRNEHDFS